MTNYYVATNGNDSNPGTLASPWRTIQKAANTAIAGDTAYIKAGTYNERVIFQTNDGNSTNWITFMNYGADIVIIDGTGITVQGQNNGMWQGLVDFRNRNYVKLQGIQIKNSAFFGIYINGGSNILIQNNYIYNTWASGIMTEYANTFIIDNNNIELACNATNTNGQGTQECISVSTGVDNFTISNNIVHDGGKPDFGGEGIDTKNSASNGKVFGNHVYNTNSVGIYVDAWSNYARDIEVYNNLVHNTVGAGIGISSETGGNIDRIKFYNNIIYQTEWGFLLPTYQEANTTGHIDTVSIMNNTFYNNRQIGMWFSSYWNIPSQGRNTVVSNVDIFNNIVYGNPTSIQNDLGSAINIHNNLEINPLFVNPTSTPPDFHLQSNSPAIDAGTSTNAPSFDFDGNTRPQGARYDIGAYEYVSGGCPAVTSCSITTCPPSNIVQGTATSLNVSWAGGTPNYTLQLLRDGVNYGSPGTGISTTSATINFTVDTTWTVGSHTVAVKITDTCSTPQTCTTGTCTINVTASSTTGSISCSTTPSGASVTIDGTLLSGVTPVTYPNIPTGNHTVLFKLDGYNNCTQTVNVTTNSTITATCTLTPISTSNLVQNPGFESGSPVPTNWVFYTNSTSGLAPALDTTVAHTGTNSIKMNVPGTTDSYSGEIYSDYINSGVGKTYSFSAWGKSQSTGGTGSIGVRLAEYDSSHTFLRQTSLEFNKGTIDWSQTSVNVTTGASTVYVAVYSSIYLGYGTFWVDDVALVDTGGCPALTAVMTMA
jgi:hypothetical protein